MEIENKELEKLGFHVGNKWATLNLDGLPKRHIKIQIGGGYVPFGYTRIYEGEFVIPTSKTFDTCYLCTMNSMEDVKFWINLLNES